MKFPTFFLEFKAEFIPTLSSEIDDKTLQLFISLTVGRLNFLKQFTETEMASYALILSLQPRKKPLKLPLLWLAHHVHASIERQEGVVYPFSGFCHFMAYVV
jgi:hypothetical protein